MNAIKILEELTKDVTQEEISEFTKKVNSISPSKLEAIYFSEQKEGIITNIETAQKLDVGPRVHVTVKRRVSPINVRNRLPKRKRDSHTPSLRIKYSYEHKVTKLITAMEEIAQENRKDAVSIYRKKLKQFISTTPPLRRAAAIKKLENAINSNQYVKQYILNTMVEEDFVDIQNGKIKLFQRK